MSSLARSTRFKSLASKVARTHLTVRHNSTLPPPSQPKSPHASFYSTLLPSTIPVFLLGSSVYLGLQLWRNSLEHEKAMWEAEERVNQLEAEIALAQTSSTTLPELEKTGNDSASKTWWRIW